MSRCSPDGILSAALTSAQPRAGDLGVAGLMLDPPTAEALAGFFSNAIAACKKSRTAAVLAE